MTKTHREQLIHIRYKSSYQLPAGQGCDNLCAHVNFTALSFDLRHALADIFNCYDQIDNKSYLTQMDKYSICCFKAVAKSVAELQHIHKNI